MSKTGLRVNLPSAVDNADGLRKLEHYYGIEFTRGASNGGGENGYHQMIGDATLLKEMRFHNQIKIAAVKDAAIKTVLNQSNWRQQEDGVTASVLDGSDGTDIMQVHTTTVYAILGGSNPTYERYIVSDKPFSYEGDEAKAYESYGETPDYATMVGNVLRSISGDSAVGTQVAGMGSNYSDPSMGIANGVGRPRTSLSRFAFEAAARAKNADASKNLPHTIICNQDIELAFAFMAIEFRTKIFNTLLGHGVSSNAAPSAATWGKISGYRMTSDGGATYLFGTLGQSLFVNGSTTGTAMWQIINGYSPLLKMFEAQLAVSDGATLEQVKDADGNVITAPMTGIWTKTFTFQITASTTAGGEAKLYTVEVCLRVPMWRGRTRLWGHLAQWTGGYECVRYLDSEGKTHHKVYRAPSVEALTTDSDVALKTAEGGFVFENTYDYLGELPVTTVATGQWATQMFSKDNIMTAITQLAGGSMLNYEGSANYVGVETEAGKYRRMGALFGDLAHGSRAVLRYAGVYNGPSSAGTSIGSGFRVKLSA